MTTQQQQRPLVGLFDAYALITKQLGNGSRPFYSFFGDMRAPRRSSSVRSRFAMRESDTKTSSITATLSGQIVAEGFIKWWVSVGARSDKFYQSFLRASDDSPDKPGLWPSPPRWAHRDQHSSLRDK